MTLPVRAPLSVPQGVHAPFPASRCRLETLLEGPGDHGKAVLELGCGVNRNSPSERPNCLSRRETHELRMPRHNAQLRPPAPPPIKGLQP